MRIGIDLGGSHIGMGLVDNGKLIKTVDKIFSRQDRINIKETIINEIQRLIIELLMGTDVKLDDIEAIGIAAPGTISNGVIVRAR